MFQRCGGTGAKCRITNELFHSRISNPLQDRTPEQLDRDVERFYGHHEGLQSVVSLDMLKKGARVARDSWNLTVQAVPGITEPEVSALKKERKKTAGFRAQTKELKVAILTTACAAIIQ
jgi:hypothetical protein